MDTPATAAAADTARTVLVMMVVRRLLMISVQTRRQTGGAEGTASAAVVVLALSNRKEGYTRQVKVAEATGDPFESTSLAPRSAPTWLEIVFDHWPTPLWTRNVP
jgi:hypothetical protein